MSNTNETSEQRLQWIRDLVISDKKECAKKEQIINQLLETILKPFLMDLIDGKDSGHLERRLSAFLLKLHPEPQISQKNEVLKDESNT